MVGLRGQTRPRSRLETLEPGLHGGKPGQGQQRYRDAQHPWNQKRVVSPGIDPIPLAESHVCVRYLKMQCLRVLSYLAGDAP